MDEVWKAFEDTDRKISIAYIASNQKTLMLCSYGRDEAQALIRMSELIAEIEHDGVAAMSGDYMEDGTFTMTVVLNNGVIDGRP
jgi:hypothetical protein